MPSSLIQVIYILHFSKFIQDKYGYDKQKSAYLAGAVYDVSMIVSPFLGRLIVSVLIIKATILINKQT